MGTWLTVMLNFHLEIVPGDSPSLGYCGSLLNGFHFVSQEDSCLFECEVCCVPETMLQACSAMLETGSHLQ